MKTLLLSLLFATTAPAFASNCNGVQDAKGLTADLTLTETTYKISYKDADAADMVCTYKLDKDYKPRTEDSQRNRYYIIAEKSSVYCDAKFIWMSKTVESKGEGYVDVEFPCAGGGGCAQGESGRIDSFYCTL